MRVGEKPTGARGVNQTGLWLSFFSAAIHGLTASRETNTTPEGSAKDAADVADAAFEVAMSRLNVLNAAALQAAKEAAKEAASGTGAPSCGNTEE